LLEYRTCQLEFFTLRGLNLQAIFNVEDLPSAVSDALAEQIDEFSQYRQLLLIGHAGRELWTGLQQAGSDSSNPVDDYTRHAIDDYFHADQDDYAYQMLYPGPYRVDLLQLGELAGWHHPSPFWLGVNKVWGSWFAYRAVILANTNLSPTQNPTSQSPCDNCIEKPCIPACPPKALDNNCFDLMACSSYRSKDSSPCGYQCIARNTCPIGKDHRYSNEQIKYHYSISLKTIKERASSF